MIEQTGTWARRAKIALWRSLMEVHESVLREIERELAECHRMSVREFDTLVNIPRNGIPLRELTDKVVLSQSAVSRLVDRLARQGLIDREGIAGDSRAVRVRLTDRGRKATKAAARTNADVVERLFADRLSPAELDVLDTVLTRLRGELDAGER